MADLHHLTVTTGHVRVSPRSEVEDDVIETLRPIVRAGSGIVGGLRIEISGNTYDLHVGHSHAVRCVLGTTPEDWASLRELAAAAGQPVSVSEPPLPWLAVLLMPGLLAVSPEQAEMLGDAERCVAYALLEER